MTDESWGLAGYCFMVAGAFALVAGIGIGVSDCYKNKRVQCEARGGIYLDEENVCFRGERILLDGEE